MEITEVRIKLMPLQNDKLRAFCSITIDEDFVIRDLKIIDGTKGPFVAMPSRKLMERCSRCGGKNHHRARFCNECGARLPPERSPGDSSARPRLHADIAHPINSRCREVIQKRILDEYLSELERAKEPGYRPADLDVFDVEALEEAAQEETAARAERAGPGTALEAGRTPDREPAEVERGAPCWDGAAGGPEGRRDRRDPRDRFRDRRARASRGAGLRPDEGRRERGERGESARSADAAPRFRTARDAVSERPDRLAPSPGAGLLNGGGARDPRASEPEPEDNFGAGLFS